MVEWFDKDGLMANTLNSEGRGFDRGDAFVDLSAASLAPRRLGKPDGIEVKELWRQLASKLSETGDLSADLQKALLAGDVNEAVSLSQTLEQRIPEIKKGADRLFTGLIEISAQLRRSNFELESHCADLGIKIQEIGFILDELQR